MTLLNLLLLFVANNNKLNSRQQIYRFEGYYSASLREDFTCIVNQKGTLTMVEGHSVHRVASLHRKRLIGKKFQACSPNGRFIDGATAINNRSCS